MISPASGRRLAIAYNCQPCYAAYHVTHLLTPSYEAQSLHPPACRARLAPHAINAILLAETTSVCSDTHADECTIYIVYFTVLPFLSHLMSSLVYIVEAYHFSIKHDSLFGNIMLQ